jgi:adenosylcobinamide-GDP ribazoletransferase
MADDPFRAELDAVITDLKGSLAFLTRVPGWLVGETGETRPDFSRAARVFPVIGILIGIVAGAVLVIVRELGESPLVTAGLAVLATFLLTGGLHEDGLADTADGFGGGETASEKLEIMDDSRIGTYGAAALLFSLGLRTAALANMIVLSAWHAAFALLAAEAVSRAAMVRLWYALPAARPGLSEQTGPPDPQAMLTAIIVAAVVVVVTIIPTFGFWAAVAASLLAALVTGGLTLLARSQIGGRTGDTLGACQQAAAVAFLIGLAAF